MNSIGKLMMMLNSDKTQMVTPEDALPGRSEPDFVVPETHAVLGTPLQPPFPEGIEVAYFALGCFWGAERLYWELDGVYSTAVGYQEGVTPNPTYEEVCSGKTGHAEAVMVAYDPTKISYEDLLKVFFEEHDPTQGMRQGNDVGTQYRSAIYWTTPEQEQTARDLTKIYGDELHRQRIGDITTEIRPASEITYYYAEDHHQQYLAKNPFGYRCHANTGVRFPATA